MPLHLSTYFALMSIFVATCQIGHDNWIKGGEEGKVIKQQFLSILNLKRAHLGEISLIVVSYISACKKLFLCVLLS